MGDLAGLSPAVRVTPLENSTPPNNSPIQLPNVRNDPYYYPDPNSTSYFSSDSYDSSDSRDSKRKKRTRKKRKSKNYMTESIKK